MTIEPNGLPDNIADTKSTIYEQDCEFYRHQDNLKWNRLQTTIVIEGGYLVALAYLIFDIHQLYAAYAVSFLNRACTYDWTIGIQGRTGLRCP